MKTILSLAAAVAMLSSPVLAADDVRISTPGDGALSCEQLAAETARMNTLMGKSSEDVAKAETGAKVSNLAASAAINGALYSGALGQVPGLGMFANGAAAMAQKAAAKKAKDHEALVQTATSRAAVMDALFQAKNCGKQPAEAAATPAAKPAL